MGQQLVLRHQRGGRVLRHHEARVDARALHQQPGQPVVSLQQQVGAAFADRAQLGQRDGGQIEGDRHWLAVKIAAGNDVPVGKHQGIVGHGVDFRLDAAVA